MLAGRLPWQGNGLADPLAEGIHKDTDGPDKASDRVQYVAHLPGRYLALADVCASAFRLGHGPHLLPKPSLPGKDIWMFREKVMRGGGIFTESSAPPLTSGNIDRRLVYE